MSKNGFHRPRAVRYPVGRLMVTIDRLLMSSARMAVRNGDLPISGFEPVNTAFVRSHLSFRLTA